MENYRKIKSIFDINIKDEDPAPVEIESKIEGSSIKTIVKINTFKTVLFIMNINNQY